MRFQIRALANESRDDALGVGPQALFIAIAALIGTATLLAALLTVTAAHRAIAIVSSSLSAAVLTAGRLLSLIALLATETGIRLRTGLPLILVSLLVGHGSSLWGSVLIPRDSN